MSGKVPNISAFVGAIFHKYPSSGLEHFLRQGTHPLISPFGTRPLIADGPAQQTRVARLGNHCCGFGTNRPMSARKTRGATRFRRQIGEASP